MNVDNLLNFERRTGIKNTDIEDFERKASEVEAAIKGLVDGTVDPNNIHIEGIETDEEKAQKAAIAEEKSRLHLIREEELKLQRKREEKERWWNGAEVFQHQTDVNTPPDLQNQLQNELQAKAVKIGRYTADYSKWDTWTPSDDVTRLEEEELKSIEEKKLNEEFERNNPDFCTQFLDDMSARKKNIAKKQDSADTLRLKGNKHFKLKNYPQALELYMDALKLSPFDSKLLLNIAQVHIKCKALEDGLEFLKRTLFLDSNNIKALSRQAFCLSELGDSSTALLSINKALLLDPENVELQAQFREVTIVETEKQAEQQLQLASFNVNDQKNVISVLFCLQASLNVGNMDLEVLHLILQQPEEAFDSIAKAYFRTSNCLLLLINTVKSTFVAVMTVEKSTFLSSALKVIIRGINSERSGKQLLLDQKLIPLLRDMIADICDTNRGVFIAAVELVTVLCKDDTCLKSRLTVFADKLIISLIGNALGNLSNNLLTSSALAVTEEMKEHFLAVEKVLDLVKVLATCDPGRVALTDATSSVQVILVLSMGTALHAVLEQQSGFGADAMMVMVEIFLGLSQVATMRTAFSLELPLDNGAGGDVTVVGTIMSAIRMHSEHAANLLAVLMNAAIEATDDNEHAVRKAIITAGGIELALSHDCNQKEDDEDVVILRNRKAGLLSRLVALPAAQTALLAVNNTDSTCASFSLFCQRIVQLSTMKAEGKLDESKHGNIARWQHDELTHLVRALATLPGASVSHAKIKEVAFESKLMTALLSLLPLPRMDCGEITPQSVILVPYVIPPTVLVGNAARGLLLFADDIPCAREIFVDKKNIGVQRLVCAMATCDDIRVRRNIAIVLAKGCRLQEGDVKEKVKHFRGLQMMIELQDKL